MSRRLGTIRLFLPLLALLAAVSALADPPVLPPAPPPTVPCMPLICLQMTDAVPQGPDYLVEFEILNWTAFEETDAACLADPRCPDRTSPGGDVYGVSFVRLSGRSTAPMLAQPVDPNGAPLAEGDVLGEGHPVGGSVVAPTVDLDEPWVTGIVEILWDDAGTWTLVPSSCYSLTDAEDGIVTFSTAPACPDLGLPMPEDVEVTYRHALGGPDTRNTWGSTNCTSDVITWFFDSSDPGAMPVPPSDTNLMPCPTTCVDKDSGDNVLDGFVIRIPNFAPDERLVFNWYLLDRNGSPIASGAPPTPTSAGTLGPSFRDPWGFSYGSFQIDRKASCLGGDCDTMIMMTPTPVNDPAVSCLIDEDLVRNSIPFDAYVSITATGGTPPCDVQPALVPDEKGLNRLVVRATGDASIDNVIVQFTNAATQVIEKSDIEPLVGGEKIIETTDIVGVYDISAVCESGPAFFLVAPVRMAIPDRGDLPNVPSDVGALVVNGDTGGFAVTGSALGDLNLGTGPVEACHFVQLVDQDGEVRIIGGPSTLVDNGTEFVRDEAPPSITCQPDVVVGTNSDGGADCFVDVQVAAVATDEAGGFVVTNTLLPADRSRSFGSRTGEPEVAWQAAEGTFTIGPPTPIDFTVEDDAGVSATCTTTVQVVDDTPPVVTCGLEFSGPGQGVSDQFFVVAFTVTDNCDPSPSVVAEIDGIPVTLGQVVHVTNSRSNGVHSHFSHGGDILHITTPLGGILSVTATDAAGNVGTCHTCALAAPAPVPDDDEREKGNNGVGNGEDPQPPGNPPVNDGPGTGPGDPGNRGGGERE